MRLRTLEKHASLLKARSGRFLGQRHCRGADLLLASAVSPMPQANVVALRPVLLQADTAGLSAFNSFRQSHSGQTIQHHHHDHSLPFTRVWRTDGEGSLKVKGGDFEELSHDITLARGALRTVPRLACGE